MSEQPALIRKSITTPRPAARAGALLFVLALFLPGCQPPSRKSPMPAPSRPLAEVLAAHTPGLMAIPGVVGTAESRTSDGRPCILLMLSTSAPELRAKLPSELEGWPVRLEVTGEFHAMPDSGR
jgi:hypothetical protein